jgi:hypothetical protein
MSKFRSEMTPQEFYVDYWRRQGRQPPTPKQNPMFRDEMGPEALFADYKMRGYATGGQVREGYEKAYYGLKNELGKISDFWKNVFGLERGGEVGRYAGTPTSFKGYNELGNDRFLDIETGDEISGEELLKRHGMGNVKFAETREQSMGPAERVYDNIKDIWRFMGILPKKEKGESGLAFGKKNRGGFAR